MKYTVFTGTSIASDPQTAYLQAMRDAKAHTLNIVESRRIAFDSSLERANNSDFDPTPGQVYPAYVTQVFSSEPERLVGAGFCSMVEKYNDLGLVFHGEYFGMDTNDLKEHIADSGFLQTLKLIGAEGDVNADWDDANRKWSGGGFEAIPTVTVKCQRLPRTERGNTLCIVLVAVFWED
jgi:pyruvoyl-dependent arginine decarboxylase (PvlArgDC)